MAHRVLCNFHVLCLEPLSHFFIMRRAPLFFGLFRFCHSTQPLLFLQAVFLSSFSTASSVEEKRRERVFVVAAAEKALLGVITGETSGHNSRHTRFLLSNLRRYWRHTEMFSLDYEIERKSRISKRI